MPRALRLMELTRISSIVPVQYDRLPLGSASYLNFKDQVKVERWIAGAALEG